MSFHTLADLQWTYSFLSSYCFPSCSHRLYPRNISIGFHGWVGVWSSESHFQGASRQELTLEYCPCPSMCYSCVLYVVLFKRKDYAYVFLENWIVSQFAVIIILPCPSAFNLWICRCRLLILQYLETNLIISWQCHTPLLWGKICRTSGPAMTQWSKRALIFPR